MLAQEPAGGKPRAEAGRRLPAAPDRYQPIRTAFVTLNVAVGQNVGSGSR